jgi:hypothetical protein
MLAQVQVKRAFFNPIGPTAHTNCISKGCIHPPHCSPLRHSGLGFVDKPQNPRERAILLFNTEEIKDNLRRPGALSKHHACCFAEGVIDSLRSLARGYRKVVRRDSRSTIASTNHNSTCNPPDGRDFRPRHLLVSLSGIVKPLVYIHLPSYLYSWLTCS